MSASGPTPEYPPDFMVHPVERLLGRAMLMVVGPATNDRVQQADQQGLADRFVHPTIPRTFSINACVFFFDGFTRGLPSYLRRFCPRKSNPSSIWVTCVLSVEIASPRSFKNSSTKGRTSFSSSSFEAPVMMKSSAYRTRLTLGVHLPPSFHFCLGKCSASSFSSPSKVMFASVGEMMPPCRRCNSTST